MQLRREIRQVHHLEPRISLNKLGEYLTATSEARRRRILLDQKFPSGIVVPRYRRFFPSVRRYVSQRGHDRGLVEGAIAELKAVNTGTPWNQDDSHNTAAALNHFLKIAPRLTEGGCEFLPPPRKNTFLMIEGVKVAISPHYILHAVIDGRPALGVVKFHLIKNVAKHMGAIGAQHAATLLHRWLIENLTDATRLPHPSLCFIVECWQDRITAAPERSEDRMENIARACREIAVIWPTLRLARDAA